MFMDIPLTDVQYQFINSILPKGYTIKRTEQTEVKKTKGRRHKVQSISNENTLSAIETEKNIEKKEKNLIKPQVQSQSEKRETKNVPNEKKQEKESPSKSQNSKNQELVTGKGEKINQMFNSIESSPKLTKVQEKDQTKKEKHIEGKNIVSFHFKELQKRFRIILTQISKKKNSEIFIEPVDPVKLGIPKYFKIIKHPMAINTMIQKLNNQQYPSSKEFKHDLGLIVKNALKFNEGNEYIVKLTRAFEKDCNAVLQKFEAQIKQIQTEIKKNKIKGKGKSTGHIKQEKAQQEQNSEEQQNSQDQNKEIKNSQKVQSLKSQTKSLTITKKVQKFTNQNKNKKRNFKKKLKQESNDDTSVQSQPQQQKMYDQKSQKDQNSQKKSRNFNSEVLSNKNEKQQSSPQNQSQNSKEQKVLKTPKKSASGRPRQKKYSFEERMKIIERIRLLDRQTMKQFFGIIKFSSGESMDFKVMQDKQVEQIDTKLVFYEERHREKLRQIQEKQRLARKQNGSQAEQELQIAEDQDYND